MLANTMKNNATIDQLITFARNILSPNNTTPLKQLDIKWAKKMCASTKTRAKKSGLVHTILPTDIKVSSKCVYLNTPLTYLHGQGCVQSNVSLDRIDSSKGYTPDNIQVISRVANLMKNNATEEQLITFAKNVLAIHAT